MMKKMVDSFVRNREHGKRVLKKDKDLCSIDRVYYGGLLLLTK